MTAGIPGRAVPPSHLDQVCVELADIKGTHNYWCPTARQARAMAASFARSLGPDYDVDHDVRPRPHYHAVHVTRALDGTPRRRRLSGHFFYGGRPPYSIRSRQKGRGLTGELDGWDSGTWRRVRNTIVLDGFADAAHAVRADAGTRRPTVWRRGTGVRRVTSDGVSRAGRGGVAGAGPTTLCARERPS